MKKQSLRSALKSILESLDVGEECTYDVGNRNFESLYVTYHRLTKSNKTMLDKKFSGAFADEKTLFVITRIS